MAKPRRSAPGPDGITYLAGAAVGEPAVEVLWAVAQALMDGHDALGWLNASLMVLIPKWAAEDGDPASGRAVRTPEEAPHHVEQLRHQGGRQLLRRRPP